jgi:hypothetical protein
MLRLAGEHDLQFGERLARSIERKERIGMLIENVDVIGRERAGLVE